ncbi:FecR family protein [Pedobacter caeni]|uniref:FecR family protein n=1 Tax=Pedobacter caeni TaxID=288992 RepID=A0A1M5GDI6_9SPHI|nr:FecR domain-containing protein [Pedobacter caeni]SHG01749.1 FecR family protein [Pedobacter caeni]
MKKKVFNNDLERIDAAWEKLEPMLGEDQPATIKLKPWFNRKLAAAAILILATTIGLWFMTQQNGELQYVTKYGETARIVLPDSSVVFLNGNSKLSYQKNWSGKGDREVKVDGEAYFSVKHTHSNQKFFVRMADSLSVEVLGTEFNISKRNNETRVVLNSGKIDFHMDRMKDEKSGVIQMKPGDLVEYQSKAQAYTKRKVDPAVYSSWKSSRLVFEKTTLKEVLKTLKDTYGLHIEVQDPSLLNKSVSGSAPTKNIDILIKGLSEIFNINFIKKGDTLIVTTTTATIN